MYTKQEMHEKLINAIKRFDYTFMYSEDNEVWAKAREERNYIKFHILALINMHDYKKEQLLNECLSLHDPNSWEGMTHKGIKSFFEF